MYELFYAVVLLIFCSSEPYLLTFFVILFTITLNHILMAACEVYAMDIMLHPPLL